MRTSTIRLLVLVLLGCAIAVTALLVQAGLPVPAALTLGLLVVGGATTAVERRMGRSAPVLGITFLSLSGLAGIAAAVRGLPQVNGWVVGLGTLALEIGALIGVLKLYRPPAGQAGSVVRRRLAYARGWHSEPRATVPVPGPRTASRLKSVPSDATETTGTDVVRATINALTVTLFDRSRPGAHPGEPGQTVWLVHLPVPLPYFSPEDALAGSDVARILMTTQARSVASGVGFPRSWWIEGGYLCCVYGDGTRGAAAQLVAEYAERLTALAAAFPWPELAPYATVAG